MVIKKICLLLIFFTSFPLTAQNVNYPDIINNGTIFINGGMGFGYALTSKVKLPPVIISADIAIPIAALPISTGIIFAFSTEEGSIDYEETEHSSSNFGFAFRLGYHEGWGISRLDTYLGLTLGAIMNELRPIFWFGLGIGGRYFFHPRFGINAELKLGNFYNFSLALSCRI